MALSKTEAKQLLERLIFEEQQADDWVQDIWGLSPLHGDSAAKLFEVFEALIEACPDDQLEALLNSYYQDSMQDSMSDRN
jgi:hypothetical protein